MTGENKSRPTRLYILAIAILVCVAMLLGCAEPAHYVGIVTANDGTNPLSGVAVTITGDNGDLFTVTSATDGTCQFPGLVEGVTYAVTSAVKTNYAADLSGVAPITYASQTTAVALTYSPPPSISSGNIPSPSPF